MSHNKEKMFRRNYCNKVHIFHIARWLPPLSLWWAVCRRLVSLRVDRSSTLEWTLPVQSGLGQPRGAVTERSRRSCLFLSVLARAPYTWKWWATTQQMPSSLLCVVSRRVGVCATPCIATAGPTLSALTPSSAHCSNRPARRCIRSSGAWPIKACGGSSIPRPRHTSEACGKSRLSQ